MSRGRRILIVDDDLKAADELARELALHDIEVTRTLAIAEVVAIMMPRKVRFDAIIMEAAANDYLAKPFRIASLMARLRAHGRSYQTNSYAMLAVGPLHFNPGKRLLFTADTPRPKRLTEKEAALFGALYRETEMPVDRTQLMREVWG